MRLAEIAASLCQVKCQIVIVGSKEWENKDADRKAVGKELRNMSGHQVEVMSRRYGCEERAEAEMKKMELSRDI